MFVWRKGAKNLFLMEENKGGEWVRVANGWWNVVIFGRSGQGGLNGSQPVLLPWVFLHRLTASKGIKWCQLGSLPGIPIRK